MRLRLLALLPLLLAPMRAGDDVPPFARETPAVKSGDPVFQFNGKDLSGLYTYLKEHKYEDPKGVFTVRDGLLRISGEEWGGVATKESYRDYHLVVEWKWGEATWGARAKAARDSGILVHGVGDDGAAGGQWLESIECQVIEGGTGDFILVGGKGKPSLTCETRRGPDGQPYYEKGADALARDAGRINWWGRDPSWKDVLGFRGRRDVEKPAGDWNRMEVICDGGSITTLLNGLVVNAGTKSRPDAGKVMIQSEGAEILVRTFEIRPLRK